MKPSGRNILGCSQIERSFVIASMPQGPGRALDFGAGDSFTGLVARRRGFDVVSLDRTPVFWHYRMPGLEFLQEDLLRWTMPDGTFDLVINVSSVEHVGLAGRYGVRDPLPEGDLEAMRKLMKLMKPGARMLLTIPVGLDAIFSPMCRVYGEQRLPRLLEGFTTGHEEYWIKNPENQWARCSRSDALNAQADAGHRESRNNIYALGCYYLRKPES